MLDEENKDKQKSSILLDIAESFLSSFIILMVLYVFLAFPEVVSGASMEPTLYDGERILVEKVSKRFNGFSRGDVIVFHPPGNDDIDYVKRIIAVPGDVFKLEDCSVFITNSGERFLLEEPYLYENTCTYSGPRFEEGKAIKVLEGEYLVLGDNRPRSADSRVFGLISEERVVGKAVFRFWPLGKASFL